MASDQAQSGAMFQSAIIQQHPTLGDSNVDREGNCYSAMWNGSRAILLLAERFELLCEVLRETLEVATAEHMSHSKAPRVYGTIAYDWYWRGDEEQKEEKQGSD